MLLVLETCSSVRRTEMIGIDGDESWSLSSPSGDDPIRGRESIPSDLVGSDALLLVHALLVLGAPSRTCLQMGVAPLLAHVVQAGTSARCQERKHHNRCDPDAEHEPINCVAHVDGFLDAAGC